MSASRVLSAKLFEPTTIVPEGLDWTSGLPLPLPPLDELLLHPASTPPVRTAAVDRAMIERHLVVVMVSSFQVGSLLASDFSMRGLFSTTWRGFPGTPRTAR